ncbi:DUF4142 domain-containing protein [Bordetella sp. 2513F-2]
MEMKVLTLTLLTAGTLACSAGAVAQSQTPAADPASPQAPAAEPAAPQTQDAGESQLDGDDEDFLENAAQSGHTEVEGSKLAQTKAKSPDVKSFAERMIQDHTKVAEELAALAKEKGYTPPAEPSLMQKAKLKTLGLTDDGFDKMYASQIGVSAHEDAVELFRNASEKAKDPDIKAFAAKTLPALEEHLEMARALQQKVGAD